MTNEEKYKTPEERKDAYIAFCDQYDTCNDCRLFKMKRCSGRDGCAFNWLALEDEEEKPQTSPSRIDTTGLGNRHVGGNKSIPISESERNRLALIAHHAEKLVELFCDGKNYEESIEFAHRFGIVVYRLEYLAKYINNKLNKEETK